MINYCLIVYKYKLKFLITGGLGFIGSTLIKKIIQETKHHVLNLDKQTYASNLFNLKSIEKNQRYSFVKGDICDEILVKKLIYNFRPNYLMHLAAESHVDNSINNPSEFISTNIIGTFKLLKICYQYWESLPFDSKNNFKFHHISTDEVYGSQTSDKLFTEESKYDPSSPYAASKASSDHLVRAWFKTYNMPILISNCSNNYGPYQSMEKLIPLTIYNSLNHKSIPIYGDGLQVRDWIYVKDHCEALKKILFNGEPGDVYNIGSSIELKNIDIVRKICSILDLIVPIKKNKSYSELISFVEDRPGHDYRYAINSNKIKEQLGWEPKTSFQEGIESTIKWYLNNNDWIQRATGKSFKDWINLQYSQ